MPTPSTGPCTDRSCTTAAASARDVVEAAAKPAGEEFLRRSVVLGTFSSEQPAPGQHRAGNALQVRPRPGASPQRSLASAASWSVGRVDCLGRADLRGAPRHSVSSSSSQRASSEQAASGQKTRPERTWRTRAIGSSGIGRAPPWALLRGRAGSHRVGVGPRWTEPTIRKASSGYLREGGSSIDLYASRSARSPRRGREGDAPPSNPFGRSYPLGSTPWEIVPLWEHTCTLLWDPTPLGAHAQNPSCM